MSRIAWAPVIERAAEIVASYDTPVTLRQTFYRLVAEALIPNTFASYQRLAVLTAEGRRRGTFPDLADGTRRISLPPSWGSATEAQDWLCDIYRRDRTEGQPYSVLLAVEKATLEAQMESWFEDRGLPIAALRGYPSQALVDQVDAGDFDVILYAGDFDPTGEDIPRDLMARLGPGPELVRVALTPDQVEEYQLPPAPGKRTDSRARGFQARHGRLIQVEVEALDPNDLRQMFEDTLGEYWDPSAYEQVLEQEAREREELSA